MADGGETKGSILKSVSQHARTCVREQARGREGDGEKDRVRKVISSRPRITTGALVLLNL